MRIGLKQGNLEADHDKLMEMQALELAIRDGLSANSYASSTPGSENYGRHMTPEEAVDFFTPS
jgi:tripeptidyl-peptidase-1